MLRAADDAATYEDHQVAMWCCGHCVNLFLDHARALSSRECLLKALMAWRLANGAIVFCSCLQACTVQATSSLQTVAAPVPLLHASVSHGILDAALLVVVQMGFVVSGSLIACSMRYRMEISTWIRVFAYSERTRRRTLDMIVAHWKEYVEFSDMPSLVTFSDMPSLVTSPGDLESVDSEESSDYDFGSR